MTDSSHPSSIIAALRSVRRHTPPPPGRARDAIGTEQLFFRCLLVALLVSQALAFRDGYGFLDRLARPFPVPEREVYVAVPDAK